MTDFKKTEVQFLDHLKSDYVPLNDVVRMFSGFDRTPSEEDFKNTLEFLEYAIIKHNIIYLEGPRLTEITMSIEDFLNWLRSKWYLGQYNQIDYGVWFDKKE